MNEWTNEPSSTEIERGKRTAKKRKILSVFFLNSVCRWQNEPDNIAVDWFVTCILVRNAQSPTMWLPRRVGEWLSSLCYHSFFFTFLTLSSVQLKVYWPSGRWVIWPKCRISSLTELQSHARIMNNFQWRPISKHFVVFRNIGIKRKWYGRNDF